MAHILRLFIRDHAAKIVDTVFLSTDDRRKLDNKTCFRKMYIQKACGATDDASDYESRKCRFGSCQAQKRSFHSIAFGETEQDYPVDRHQKVFTATRHELINQEQGQQINGRQKSKVPRAWAGKLPQNNRNSLRGASD